MGKVLTEYRVDDRLRDAIDDNNLLLLVISRFSIPFGFGDSTIGEVCEENGIDCATFLSVANLVCAKKAPSYDVSPRALIDYLKKAHTYFLDFNLPLIRRKLIDAVNNSSIDDVAFLIIKYFDDYVIEVRRHMEYENDTLFGYISRIASGEAATDYSIEEYSATHTDMGDKLNELKDIIIRHYRQKGNDTLNSVLYDIINCQADLVTHCMVENRLLVPAVRKLEQSIADKASIVPKKIEKSNDTGKSPDSLSEREKEVIVCVAKGKSNKEIADELCLSINTVTTHRRNIASKLQIHSQSGLAIFAIIHHLIDIKEIKLQ